MQKNMIALACFPLMLLMIIAGPTAEVNLANAAVQHQETTYTLLDSDSTSGSKSWDHTVSSGTDRILIVTTAIDAKSGATVSGVTFDGNLLTRRVIWNPAFDEEVQLWYMLDPPVGTFPVTIEYTYAPPTPGTFFGLQARASTYAGVSQNRPISAVATASGTTSPATVTITSAANELVIDALGYNTTGTMTPDGTQTERFNQSSAFNGSGGSEKAGAASVTMSWGLQNPDDWTLVAASLRPSQTPTVRTVTVMPSGGDYTSLNAALAGEAADLVALNRQLNIELYAMTDTVPVDLATPAYTTDADHYIKVYTPQSQRHAGVWDSAKYNLAATAQVVASFSPYPACFNVGEVDLWLDGIQAVCSYSGTDYPSMIAADPGTSGSATLRVSNSIFKGNWTNSSGAENANFIITYNWPPNSEMWMWNTIATDFWWADQSRGRGLHTYPTPPGTQGGEIWWSNVTLANMANAVSLNSLTHLHVRNSLAVLPAGGTSWFAGAWNDQSDSDFNASNQAETLAGANSLPSSTFTFRGVDDWRLAAADTGAQDNGINSFNSYHINDGKDVAGFARSALWDIGASEYVDTTAPVTTASPAGGTYASAQSVTLTANETATIYYTTDGSTPTTSSTVYSSAITIANTSTLQFFAVDVVGNTETVKSQIYIIDSTAPVTTASPTGGTYTSAQSVTLTSNEPSTIYYTTNGSTPTTSSTVYSSAISITGTTTLQFFAVDVAGNSEAVKTEVYTFNIDVIAPVTTASPAGGTYTSAQSVTLTASEPATIYYTTDGTTPDLSSPVYSGAISIATTTQLQFFAVDTVGNTEGVNIVDYIIQSAAPGGGSSGGGGGGGCFISSIVD